MNPFPPARELEEPLRELLSNFSYRPGWNFSVENGHLIINAIVTDANNQTETCPLTSVQRIPSHVAICRDFDWMHWLFNVILELERHETQEFFRVNGQPVYEPHPELDVK